VPGAGAGDDLHVGDVNACFAAPIQHTLAGGIVAHRGKQQGRDLQAGEILGDIAGDAADAAANAAGHRGAADRVVSGSPFDVDACRPDDQHILAVLDGEAHRALLGFASGQYLITLAQPFEQCSILHRYANASPGLRLRNCADGPRAAQQQRRRFIGSQGEAVPGDG